MSIKNIKLFSNFDLKKRKKKKIKFIIFHYTGMKKENDAIQKLTSHKSKVSCHYFIKKNGEILTLVPDLYIAWHAGKSYWKNYELLNNNSIGIEISNPGHQFNYKKFSKQQIKSITKLSKYLMIKYKIKLKMFWVILILLQQEKKILVKNFLGNFLQKKLLFGIQFLEMI